MSYWDIFQAYFVYMLITGKEKKLHSTIKCANTSGNKLLSSNDMIKFMKNLVTNRIRLEQRYQRYAEAT